MTRLDQRRESFPMGDGYDYMEVATRRGWRPIAGWGVDGWDLGDWPYVIVLHRDRPGRFELAYYVEGDIRVDAYDSDRAREAATDQLAWWHWRHAGAPWIAGIREGEEPDRLRGPYRDEGARTFTVRSSDIDRCPNRSMAPGHYRDDGTCRCHPA